MARYAYLTTNRFSAQIIVQSMNGFLILLCKNIMLIYLKSSKKV